MYDGANLRMKINGCFIKGFEVTIGHPARPIIFWNVILLQTPKPQKLLFGIAYLEKYRSLTFQTLRGSVPYVYQYVTTFKF